MSDVLVAVYGSLRKGLGNHRVMEIAKGELVDAGYTSKNCNLYDLGAFPSVSLAHSSANKPVRVEVYQVPEDGVTGPLDGLEGYPHFYNRTVINVDLDNGEVVQAWLYHIDAEKSKLVESGDWVKYLEER